MSFKLAQARQVSFKLAQARQVSCKLAQARQVSCKLAVRTRGRRMGYLHRQIVVRVDGHHKAGLHERDAVDVRVCHHDLLKETHA